MVKRTLNVLTVSSYAQRTFMVLCEDGVEVLIAYSRYGHGRAWKTHLLQDLQPYICTYPECEGAEQLFRSRREWSEHEASHRKAWRCPEHPHAVFRARTGLEEHLRHEHADSFPENQLDSIVKVGETSTVDLRENCPICFAVADMEGIGALQNRKLSVSNVHVTLLTATQILRTISKGSLRFLCQRLPQTTIRMLGAAWRPEGEEPLPTRPNDLVKISAISPSIIMMTNAMRKL